ncbi:hypothetical protein LOD99_2055 [Oopsacas minuta]|uniref:Uncharacterized protein n=1 Tax=Oopsacas minuta TaxID=111878 RepID=A0AAV7K5G4_9METZ|nr:hypothetical protein LOD99_2055 [Oopsacas minuta]
MDAAGDNILRPSLDTSSGTDTTTSTTIGICVYCCYNKRKSMRNEKLSQKDIRDKVDIQPMHEYDYSGKQPIPNPDYLEMQPIPNPDYLEMQPIPNPDYLEMQPIPNPDYVDMQPGRKQKYQN